MLAVQGFCTLHSCVQTPLHGTWHTWQQRGSLQRPCGAPYPQLVWPKSSSYYSPLYAIHWAIAAGARRAYNLEPGQQIWGTLGMLCTMATAVRSETDFAILALAIFNACHGLWVGEDASIRSADISLPGWASFYDRKTKRRWEYGQNGGDRPCWRAGLCSARPSTYHSSRRRNSSA